MNKVNHRPEILREARAYRYGTWAGNPAGSPYREGFCIREVFSSERGALHHQCSNRVRFGTPWCAIHTPGEAERRRAARPPTRFEREMAELDRREQEMRRYRRMERALREIAKARCGCAEIAERALRKRKAG